MPRASYPTYLSRKRDFMPPERAKALRHNIQLGRPTLNLPSYAKPSYAKQSYVAVALAG